MCVMLAVTCICSERGGRGRVTILWPAPALPACQLPHVLSEGSTCEESTSWFSSCKVLHLSSHGPTRPLDSDEELSDPPPPPIITPAWGGHSNQNESQTAGVRQASVGIRPSMNRGSREAGANPTCPWAKGGVKPYRAPGSESQGWHYTNNPHHLKGIGGVEVAGKSQCWSPSRIISWQISLLR